MKPPAAVTICGYPYAVVMVDKGVDDETRTCGEVDYFNQTLLISNDQPALHERAVVLHEIIHGIAMHTGQHELRQHEGQTDALAYALVVLLRSNPELVKYLTDEF